MTRKLPAFDLMWKNYPHGEEDDVRKLVGGAAHGDWIDNFCTIRLSRVFNYSGFPVPRGPAQDVAGLHTITGGDGKAYAFRVREMREYLRATIGPPTVVRRNPAAGIDPAEFAGKKGVMAFDVPSFVTATGHFDLWNGSENAHQGYFENAVLVELWEAQ